MICQRNYFEISLIFMIGLSNIFNVHKEMQISVKIFPKIEKKKVNAID